MKDKMIGCRVSANTHEKAKAKAEEMGVTLSKMVTDWLEELTNDPTYTYPVTPTDNDPHLHHLWHAKGMYNGILHCIYSPEGTLHKELRRIEGSSFNEVGTLAHEAWDKLLDDLD